jgi:hypothetical protein
MGSYLSVADIRAEGVTTSMASDAQVTTAIADASRRAEMAARTWWEARTKTLYVNGNDRPDLDLDYPLIAITSLSIDGSAVTGTLLRPDPVSGLSFRIVCPAGRVFPRGDNNIVIVGSWGHVDVSGTSPVTPADVKWALKRWTYLLLAPVTDDDQAAERRMLTATNEGVFGRSRSRGPMLAPISGDPEVDRIITSYRRPRVAVI